MKLRNFPYASNPVIAAALGVLLVLLVVKIFNISYPITVTTKAAPSELAVTGEGKVDIIPDTASVQVGIVASNVTTVAQAETQINEANNAIVSALTGIGIKEEDIKTTNYSINPSYDFQNGRDEITGYSGNATLTIKVRQTDQLPQVITTATEAGANQIYDTQYTIDDPAKYREDARNAAIENAKQQAEKIANQLGIRLGKIVNMVESSPGSQAPIPYYGLETRDAAMGGAANLQPGSQTISSVVTLYFERK